MSRPKGQYFRVTEVLERIFTDECSGDNEDESDSEASDLENDPQVVTAEKFDPDMHCSSGQTFQLSRKKGLSLDEKRSRMMDFFYEKKDFFQLRELEKACQKEKGITSMSVKDVLTSLVDDGMVDTDKIGTSVYFWAFPSKASQNRKRKVDDLTSKLNESESKRKQLKEMISKAQVGKENTDDREQVLKALEEKNTSLKQLEMEVQQLRECDPEVLEAMKQQATQSREAANRWTDNIFSIKSWIKKKFSFDDQVIDKQFDIPEDFDYID